jgi:high affinity Mn2+ porin
MVNAWNVHGQATLVGQGYPAFPSPYEGAQSLSGSSQFKNTVSATAFLGLRLWHGGEFYFNPEIMQGFGLNNTHGVAGFPNGEAQKSNFPIPRLNVARIFLSQTFALGKEKESVEDGPNQLAGERSVSRITITAGKLAVTDFFLLNAYAGEPRTRFLNWNIYGTGAYDWTMDLLSWTWGAMVDLNQRRWALRAGYFLLPAVANTNDFDFHIPSNGHYLVEFEQRYAPFGKPGKLRLFGWLAHGNIGSYPASLAEPTTTPNYPDVTLTRGHDRFNYGLVIGLEQAITNALGVFSRASWSPEEGESMGWTDCGEAFTLGGTLNGALWRRADDTLGLAGLIEGLSPTAQRYFAAGGMGTIIGDGKLNYRPEAVVEIFYAYSPINWATATLDYQLVVNPGYNADRGPVSIFAIRLHSAF